MITLLQRSGDPKSVSDTRVLAESDRVFGGPMPTGCLYAPQACIDKNHATLQALTNAIVRADRWIQAAGPGEIIKAVPEYGERQVRWQGLNGARAAARAHRRYLRAAVQGGEQSPGCANDSVIVTVLSGFTTPLAPTPTPNCANAAQMVQRSMGLVPLATDCRIPSRMSS